jgi:hypothetical protein
MVEYLMAIGSQRINQKVTQVETGVVGGNVNAHRYFFFRGAGVLPFG